MALKILFADDSMTAQNMGKKILTDAGYEVIAVSNGAAAAKKLADKPDIIIVDVFMPGYSGLEICQKVRAAHATAKTPVILTVGKMEPYKPEDGAKVKADGVVIKPFEASDLLAVVQKFADRIALAKPSDYEKTIRMKVPVFDDTAIQEELGTVPIIPLSIPSELSSTPAIGYDELGERPITPLVPITLVSDSEKAAEHPAKPTATASAMHDFEAISSAPPLSPIAQPSVAPPVDFEQTTVFQAPPPSSIPSRSSADAHEVPEHTEALPPSAPPPVIDSQYTTDSHYTSFDSVGPASVGPASVDPASVESFSAYPDPMGILKNLEASSEPEGFTLLRERTTDFMATSAGGELEATSDPALKPAIPPEGHFLVTADIPDPALITDPTEAANAFPTRFGIEDPEDVPVGIAADVPGLYADLSPSSEAPPPPGRPQDEFEAKLAKAMAAFETSDEDEGEFTEAGSGSAPSPHLVVAGSTELMPPVAVAAAPHIETAPPVVAVTSPIAPIPAYGTSLQTAAAEEAIAEAPPASKIALVPASGEAAAPVSTDQEIRISESTSEDTEDIVGNLEDTQSMGVPAFEPLYRRATDFSHLEPVALSTKTPEPPHPVANIEHAIGSEESPYPDEPSQLDTKTPSPFVETPPHPVPLISAPPAVGSHVESLVKQPSPAIAEVPLIEVRPAEPVEEPASQPPVLKLHESLEHEPIEEDFFDPIIEEPSVPVTGHVEPVTEEPSHFLNGESAHFTLEETPEIFHHTNLARTAEVAAPVSAVEATASAPSAVSLPHAVLTDAEVVSEAVSRAMEQFIPELIANITRELEAARSKR